MIKASKLSIVHSEKSFPKLMESIYDGTIVLFIKPNAGIKIHGNNSSRSSFEDFTDDWNMTSFIDYNYPITLENV